MGGERRRGGGGLPLLLWRWVAFHWWRVEPGALDRNTLFVKLRICFYDISTKGWFLHRHRLCALWWLSLSMVALAFLRWWWLPLPLFGSGRSGCHCPFGGGGSCLCLLWRGAAILRWVVLPSRPLIEWCCSLFSSLEVVLLPSLG